MSLKPSQAQVEKNLRFASTYRSRLVYTEHERYRKRFFKDINESMNSTEYIPAMGTYEAAKYFYNQTPPHKIMKLPNIELTDEMKERFRTETPQIKMNHKFWRSKNKTRIPDYSTWQIRRTPIRNDTQPNSYRYPRYSPNPATTINSSPTRHGGRYTEFSPRQTQAKTISFPKPNQLYKNDDQYDEYNEEEEIFDNYQPLNENDANKNYEEDINEEEELNVKYAFDKNEEEYQNSQVIIVNKNYLTQEINDYLRQITNENNANQNDGKSFDHHHENEDQNSNIEDNVLNENVYEEEESHVEIVQCENEEETIQIENMPIDEEDMHIAETNANENEHEEANIEEENNEKFIEEEEAFEANQGNNFEENISNQDMQLEEESTFNQGQTIQNDYESRDIQTREIQEQDNQIIEEEEQQEIENTAQNEETISNVNHEDEVETVLQSQEPDNKEEHQNTDNIEKPLNIPKYNVEMRSNCGNSPDGSADFVVEISDPYLLQYISEKSNYDPKQNIIVLENELRRLVSYGFNWVYLTNIPENENLQLILEKLHSLNMKLLIDYHNEYFCQIADGLLIDGIITQELRQKYPHKVLVGKEESEHADYFFDSNQINDLKREDCRAFMDHLKYRGIDYQRKIVRRIKAEDIDNLQFNKRSARTATAMILTLPGMKMIEFSQLYLLDSLKVIFEKISVSKGNFEYVDIKSTENMCAWKYSYGNEHILITSNFQKVLNTGFIVCHDSPDSEMKIPYVDILTETKYLRDPNETKTEGLCVILYEYEIQIFKY